MKKLLLAALVVLLGYIAYSYLTLPDVAPLRTQYPGDTSFMRLRAEERAEQGLPPRRVQYWVPYARISPHLRRAVLVAEDSAFWVHEGIDFEQLKESIKVDWTRRRFARGASTITQQLAKNLYLSPSKNPVRKIREIILAMRLEDELSKRRILELYLNVIEWGDGIWGAEAAARTYFRKPAADLTADEAALLAAAIPNPRVFNPAAPSRALLRRQRSILSRMRAAGLLPPAPAPSAPPPAPPKTDLPPTLERPPEPRPITTTVPPLTTTASPRR